MARPGKPGEFYRYCRWFTDDDFSLSVYYNQENAIVFYDLIYDWTRNPVCLRWREGREVVAFQVEAGEDNPGKNLKPILTHAVEADETYRNLFATASQSIDPDIRYLILRHWQ